MISLSWLQPSPRCQSCLRVACHEACGTASFHPTENSRFQHTHNGRSFDDVLAVRECFPAKDMTEANSSVFCSHNVLIFLLPAFSRITIDNIRAGRGWSSPRSLIGGISIGYIQAVAQIATDRPPSADAACSHGRGSIHIETSARMATICRARFKLMLRPKAQEKANLGPRLEVLLRLRPEIVAAIC